MQSDLVRIKFQFPNLSHKMTNQHEFIGLLMETMRISGDIKYAGYLKEKDLHEALLGHVGTTNTTLYRVLSVKQKQVIERLIYATVKKCHKILPHPDLPIFIFVYPWFPGADNAVLFGGITAFATYYTMHLFIDLRSYTRASLKQTIAHEWNHLVFYRYHPEYHYSLCEHMTMEGLAEVFREEVLGGQPAPWALALTKKEIQKQLRLLKPKLNRKSMKLYRAVFFGNKEYKRWTGYSIGYRLVKEFREKYQNISWEEIIKTRLEDILETI